ncbi:hypothetical protein N5D73_23250 [Aeromonas caviae]|uniref:Uncharacterized protein n=2 Tax=Aeromonas TaxID=642 RepID=A0AA42UJ38_AERCA|nr:hypothetical protein [Aeromonas caviae]MBL0587120.1 hypothetical protein [Aeromonas caviae]MDH1507672.1 hypothetical protein [Aeromonas caviae]MDH1806879.1 hypothetical protein [Aeromonas caviae]
MNNYTTPPYSGSRSSTNTGGFYGGMRKPAQSPVPVAPQENKQTDFLNWFIPLVGIVLAGLSSYFLTLMAVKSEISENKAEISVAKEKINNLTSKVGGHDSDIKQINGLSKDLAVLSERVNSIEEKNKK